MDARVGINLRHSNLVMWELMGPSVRPASNNRVFETDRSFACGGGRLGPLNEVIPPETERVVSDMLCIAVVPNLRPRSID